MTDYSREELRRAIRNSGLRPSLKAVLWALLANTDRDPFGGEIDRTYPLHEQDFFEITGLRHTTYQHLHTLERAGWIKVFEQGTYKITPTAEALAGLVVYKKPPAPSEAMRKRVKERDGHRCVKCGATDDLTVDHIHPSRYGGASRMDNLRTLCRPCNARKGDRFEEETPF